jgi:type I restriction enzyme S subunit
VASKLDRAEPQTFGALATGEWLIVRPDRLHLDPTFASYWLNSKDTRRELRNLVKGIHLYPRDVGRLTVPLPRLAEQRRLADILDGADRLRDMRRKALANLDMLLQAMFLNHFGDPEINPKHWPVELVGSYVAAFQGGKSFASDGSTGVAAQYRILRISAVTGMTFRPQESKPAPDYYIPPTDHVVRQGDLLISRANTSELVGAIAYVESSASNLLLPDKIWRFVWRTPCRAEPMFIWALFQTPAVRRALARRSTGTSGSMKNISQAKLLSLPTILPPIQLQRDFVRQFEARQQLLHSMLESSQQIQALSYSLEQAAFHGEL